MIFGNQNSAEPGNLNAEHLSQKEDLIMVLYVGHPNPQMILDNLGQRILKIGLSEILSTDLALLPLTSLGTSQFDFNQNKVRLMLSCFEISTLYLPHCIN